MIFRYLEWLFLADFAEEPQRMNVVVHFEESGNVSDGAELPDRYALFQNYPNPFNPLTTIRFDLVQSQEVTLTLYNVHGQEVTRLIDGERLAAGHHARKLDAHALANGVYFYRLSCAGFTDVRKMVLLK
ncbi:MAG: T9SS type A sorting domain-containing protein [bacterium]